MLVKYEGQYMALKTLSKQQIIEMGLQASSHPRSSQPRLPIMGLRVLCTQQPDIQLCSIAE